jgi:S1-C subfamily serine protease
MASAVALTGKIQDFPFFGPSFTGDIKIICIFNFSMLDSKPDACNPAGMNSYICHVTNLKQMKSLSAFARQNNMDNPCSRSPLPSRAPTFCCLLKSTAAICFLFFLLFQPANGQAFNINDLSRSVVQIGNSDITGSGVFVSFKNEILILTNRHVAANRDTFKISILYDLYEPAKPAFIAVLHSFSPDFDVALLKIVTDIEDNPLNASDLVCGKNGSDNCIMTLNFETVPDDIFRGEEVAMFGYPGIGGNELFFSKGIISSVGYSEYKDKRIPVWLRTSADMAPGSSGGLAVNMSGNVIGMPTYIMSESATGGRVGNILTSQAILASLSSDNIMTSWEGFFDPEKHLVPDTPPLYGSIDLGAGLPSNPHAVEVTAGGEKDVSYLGGECVGFAAAGPDYTLSHPGGPGLLFIHFRANNPEKDATMIIKSPDGTWLCNDDAYEGTMNPAVILDDPRQGEYLIWIGSYEENTFIEGNIIISDAIPDDYKKVKPDYKLTPAFGEREIAAGFLPDPFSISVIASGSIRLEEDVIPGICCKGYVPEAPCYRFKWSGKTPALNIFFIADDPDDDAILVINSPDGNWHCNDDAHKDTFNPVVRFNDPGEGQYDIWIGTLSEEKSIQGFLIISEITEDIP